MRYAQTVEICSVCKKKFYGMPINVHGSYEYIHHTNFSNNIRTLFARTKNISKCKRADVIVKGFFQDGNKKINKTDAIEFLECFKHYKYGDKELLEEVFEKIQNKIDVMR